MAAIDQIIGDALASLDLRPSALDDFGLLEAIRVVLKISLRCIPGLRSGCRSTMA